MQVKQRLDALTSLRFFAAAMIVFHHLIGFAVFGVSDPPGRSSVLIQGVSFFFVLSGFILGHVYQKLEAWPDIVHFWRARVARVWPALVVNALLAIWLLSLDWDYRTALANLFMVNAWIPYPRYFFSYNDPSWSISTEFFFYLAFPFLIHNWNTTWKVKLLGSGLIVVSMILVSDFLHLSFSQLSNDSIPGIALIYINPVTRIFEFIFGMCIASYWHKTKVSVAWGETRASLYEISALLFVGLSIFFMPDLVQFVSKGWDGQSGAYWLSLSGGSIFASGLLIYVIAVGRGRITSWLSHPILVLLGEISFSMYLLHVTLLRYYQANMAAFPHLPNAVSFVVFWVILLLSSYLMWALVEMPSRRLMLGQRRTAIHATNAMRESWKIHLNWNSNTGIAMIALSCMFGALFFSFDHSAATYLKKQHVEISIDSLSYHAGQGDQKMVKLLIEAGIDVNGKNNRGSNALIDASWVGKAEVVSYLLDAGADINSKSSHGITALNSAVNQNHDAIALLLIDRGANPNATDPNGSTNLIDASWKGNSAIVMALLRRGADPNYIRPNDGITAMKAAAANSKLNVVQALMAVGAK